MAELIVKNLNTLLGEISRWLSKKYGSLRPQEQPRFATL
jgi:hypothetical protein